MAHTWQQTISIDEKLAIHLIESQSDLKVDSIVILGRGFDNIAYLINNKIVFRFPCREMGAEFIENEIAIMPYLAKLLSFPVSYPQFIGHSTAEYPFAFAGYYMLPGKTLCSTQVKAEEDIHFVTTLAKWLKELHSVPVLKEHCALVKSDQSWRYNVAQRIEKVERCLDHYKNYYQAAGFTYDVLLKNLNIFREFNFEHVKKTSFCHGDLYSRHLLVDDYKQLAGIIDWGDIHIGNPGIDLSVGIMLFPEEVLDIFLRRYGIIDEDTHAIAVFRSFCHPIMLLPYCYEQKQEGLKDWTILALNRAIKQVSKI